MSEVITKEMMLTLAANFMFYFALGTCGAFVKDLYDNFVNGKKRIQLTEIFIAATSTAFIFIGAESYLYSRFSFNVIIMLGFLCGVVGFELFGYLNSLKGLKSTIIEIIKIKRCIDMGIDSTSLENELKKAKIDNNTVTDTNKLTKKQTVLEQQPKTTSNQNTNEMLAHIIEKNIKKEDIGP